MRKFIINVNDRSYEVEVEEVTNGKMASSVESRPTPIPKVEEKVKKQVQASGNQEEIVAPMPGNIWKILVNDGDMVKSGDVLLILEAMKMENEIVAPRDGKVASINTTEGTTVNTGDSLVILD